MIKILNSLDKSGNVVDLTTATTDYLLVIGETATITYTSATSVPLYVKTVEGIYELIIQNTSSFTTPSDNTDYTLSANNTTYSNAFVGEWSNSYGTNGHTSGTSTLAAFSVGFGNTKSSNSRVSTFVSSKTIHRTSFTKDSGGSIYASHYEAYWNNTTTAWTSLGTITFPFAQSGKIVIRRIA